MSEKKPTPQRSRFHHGDLKQALLQAAVALASEGGPEAIALREATRRAGVAPNAAYRHFESHRALREAVRAQALASLARAIEAEIESLPRARDPQRRARAALCAVGLGYLRFARQAPGLFRTAFAARPFDLGEFAPDEAGARGAGGLDAFQLLGRALDGMVQAGLVPRARRAGAEFLAWSAVHGMAMLALDGPLRALDDARLLALGKRLVAMVEQGLAAAARDAR